ncbi:hypothetical protein ABFS82_13G155900 [Erythranthe guttata]|uniref:Coiled-coil domain-containing protein 22 homolog n=1 Tax=Erythranthe guttata TaxID=4155 RepID=A0A022QLX9_ERYGU|nr:PREDICTED: coiled-coil domain-containing protein 22 [Erythranthe guttata]EYU27465.1 hypothetical protein MIMGU_mgv1a005570mg [Erythranthe guttata]|eukprot:XP_012848930.1 PREDICTED: coiled-coil domain-containing protein 22 [Erythranthe guttata]
MEASEEILLDSLTNSGVPIPAGFTSIGKFTPETLFSVCAHALRLIDGPHNASSFPASLPEDSMPDRVKICTDLANAFNNLGFDPELSFHKFLYPSSEDLYNLVRFLVGKLPESSGATAVALRDGGNIRCTAKEKPCDVGEIVQNEEILNELNDLELKNRALESIHMKSRDDLAQKADELGSVLDNVEIRTESSEGAQSSYSLGRIESSRNKAFRDQDNSQHLDEELGLLKAAVEMVSDGQRPVEFYIEQLNDQVEAKRHKLKELESEWDVIEKPLQEKKINLEQTLSALYPEASGKLTGTKEIESEVESILAEIKRREEEHTKLSSDLEKQLKVAPRKSYIERINEITKNSRKQDNDIQGILKDIRELQLESNTIRERLNRTYAIVDETIFREAKKDPVARQAYRLLKDIHESFEQIAETILASDRSRRDAADYETRLSNVSARSLNMSKLQADLEAIRKENDLLEQRINEESLNPQFN